jgi:hypothetical protein
MQAKAWTSVAWNKNIGWEFEHLVPKIQFEIPISLKTDTIQPCLGIDVHKRCGCTYLCLGGSGLGFLVSLRYVPTYRIFWLDLPCNGQVHAGKAHISLSSNPWMLWQG